ncbi:MAG: tetratricopeptide repeat protein [Bacteroidales bacterium]
MKFLLIAGMLGISIFPAMIRAQGQFETDSLRVIAVFSKGKALLYNSYGLAEIERGDYRQALEYFTEAAAMDPGFSDAIFNRGVVQLRMGSPVEALLDFATAIQTDPRPEYLISRGLLLLERGDTANGVSDFQRAARGGALNPDAAFTLGVVRFHQAAFAEASDLFNQVLQANPESVDVINALAMVSLATGDTSVALQRMEESLQFLPDQGEVLHLMAGILFNRNSYAESQEIWLKALTNNPQDYIAMNGMAAIAHRQQQYDTALFWANSAIEANPRFSAAWNTRGNCYYAQGDYTSAESDYSLALSIDPSLYLALYNRGVCREMLRDERGACEDWKSAGENGVPAAAAYYNQICK